MNKERKDFKKIGLVFLCLVILTFVPGASGQLDIYSDSVEHTGDTFFYLNSTETILINAGTNFSDAVNISGDTQMVGTLTVGVDGTGHDVIAYSDTVSKYLWWDESADALLLTGANAGYTAKLGFFTIGEDEQAFLRYYDAVAGAQAGLYIDSDTHIFLDANGGAGNINLNGVVKFADDVSLGFGTGLFGTPDFFMEYRAATGSLHFEGNAIGTTNAFVFNDDSRDIDFRIETDNEVNALFVDGATGNITISENLTVTENITGNFFYAEIWFNDGTSIITPINVQNEWYNVTGFSTGDDNGETLNGFTHDGEGNLTALIEGKYKCDFAISFGNTGNNQEYELVIFVNDILQNQSIVHRKIGSAGDVGNAGSGSFIDLNVNDILVLRVRNRDSTADITTHACNVNLIRIGDI